MVGDGFVGNSGREGDWVIGRGDEGKPIILECRFPRSECVTETLRPRVAAAFAAFVFFAVGAFGVSGSFIRIPWSLCRPDIGLEDEDDSTVKSPSVVSVPLSSWMEKSSPSDWVSSADAVEDGEMRVRKGI